MALCCHPGLMVYCTAICLYAKIMITKCNCETGCFAIESGLGIGPWNRALDLDGGKKKGAATDVRRLVFGGNGGSRTLDAVLHYMLP